MPKAKARPTVTQQGRCITIEVEGYEFRDLEWLNLHRGILDRRKRSTRLTFLTDRIAREAFDELADLGAAGFYLLDGVLFIDDTVTELVERLIGEKQKAPRKGG